MPVRAPRLCSCGKPVPSGGRCPCQAKRDAERKARFDKTRPNSSQRGYNREWAKARKAFLALHPYCRRCGKLATVVDHIIPHRGDQTLVEVSAKAIERRPETQIIMGNLPADPGQLLMWTAFRSPESYPFRLVLPDGVTSRAWFALVFRIAEVFDSANSVIRLQADLKPTGPIHRMEGT